MADPFEGHTTEVVVQDGDHEIVVKVIRQTYPHTGQIRNQYQESRAILIQMLRCIVLEAYRLGKKAGCNG